MFLSLASIFILLHATAADFLTNPSVHYSDVLKIKCDALPYRTVYYNLNCFFVLDAHLNLEQATRRCGEVFKGAKLIRNAPEGVWNLLFIDEEKFLRDEDTSGFKKAMCVFDNPFQCATGSSTSIAGYCTLKGVGKMAYKQAENFCSRFGTLPSPSSDAENRNVIAATDSSVWLRPAYANRWSGRVSFSRFGTCAVTPFYKASSSNWCSSPVAAVSDGDDSARGYWTLADQSTMLDVLCVGDANNDDFWTAPKKDKPEEPEEPELARCFDTHKRDPKTGKCEWTGPSDACVQIWNLDQKTDFIRIPNYPASRFKGLDFDFHLPNNSRQFQPFMDRTSRAIVRRGCMATFWSDPGSANNGRGEMKILRNLEYGDYFIPTEGTGSMNGPVGNGLSRVSCYCDPFETEIVKPAKTACILNHEWNQAKQRCVWTKDDKIAGVIYNYQGTSMDLVIPNWPFNKRFDLNLRDAKYPEFEYKVTRIITRQGCFCTIYSTHSLQSWQCSATFNYGDHGCASKYAKNPLTRLDMGSMRVVCECMAGDTGKERLIRNPVPPKCIEMHAYDETTKRCEWTGPTHGCMVLTNTRKQKLVQNLMNWPSYTAGIARLWQNASLIPNWERQLTWLTVRQGCLATVYVAQNLKVSWNEMTTIANAKYGTYRVPQKDFGDVEGGSADKGANQVNCVCDPTTFTLTRANPNTPCEPGHKYDQQTGQCEWTRDKQICGIIRNDANEEHELRMNNWPMGRGLNWNLKLAKYLTASEKYYNRVVSVTVRQHCSVTMYSDDSNNSKHTLVTAGYGTHTVIKRSDLATTRIVCSCMD